MRQHGLDFLARHDHGQPLRPSGADHFPEATNGSVENMTVEKGQGTERLVLRGGDDFFRSGKVGEEGVDLALAHLGRVTHAVKETEPLDPVDVSLFGATAVVANPQGLDKTVIAPRRCPAGQQPEGFRAGAAEVLIDRWPSGEAMICCCYRPFYGTARRLSRDSD